MRRFFTTTFFILLGVLAFGQYYYESHTTLNSNPGNLNTTDEYPVGGGLSTSWTPIHSGSASTPQWTSIQNIPFSFSFNGTAVTQYKVATSGVLTFETAAITPPPSTNSTLPSASIPDKSVVVWGLRAPGTNDNIVTQTFGTAPNRQHWVFFSSYDFNGSGSSCWTYWSIVLEETTNNIYIVDQRTNSCVPQLTLGVQVDATTAEMVAGSPNITSMTSNLPDASDNVYYKFIQGNRPTYDIAGVVSTVDDIVALTNAPFDISGTLANYGSTTVNSFDLNYTINGGSAVTSNISGQNISTNSTYTATHAITWNPTSTGTYTVEMWASNINGNVDQNISNDKVSKTVLVVSQTAPRKTLVEDFGSATCPPCAPFAAAYDPILFNNGVNEINGDVTAIKYQMNWPSPGNDPFYNPDALDRRNYYGVNSIPSAFIDGDEMIYADQQEIDDYRAVPAFMDISVNMAVSGNTVTVMGSVDPYANIINSNLRLRLAIVENSINYTGGTTSQNDFHQVMRKMLPNEDGILLGNMVQGTPVNFNESYTFTIGGVAQGNYNIYTDLSNISVVAFVQDNATKEVYQSEVARSPVGIENMVVDGNSISIYPNPAKDQTNVYFSMNESAEIAVNVYNVLGSKMEQINYGKMSTGDHIVKINTADYSSGIYFIELSVGEQKISKKIMVNK